MSAGTGTATELRLAFDVGPVRAQPAGVGMYASSLARALADLLPGQLGLIGTRPASAAIDSINTVERQPFRSPNYHSWLQLFADRQARRFGASIVHYTNAAAPLLARLPYVLTVHDLSVVRMPGTHPLARRATLPVSLLAIARAQAIVVPSEWTRRELVRLRVPPDRVTVIAHAAAEAPTAIEADADQVLERLGVVNGDFILAVGTIEPRKNLVRLVEAFELLAGSHPTLQLVLVGAPGWHYRPILGRIEQSPVRERIVLAGYQAADTLAVLMRASAACAYVSVYEGFGMPVLDAMALGAAVVTSNRSAMPATAGGAAVLVDPFDVADIARGLARALEDRAELIESGLRRAAGRTWSDVASEHVEVYRRVLDRLSGGT